MITLTPNMTDLTGERFGQLTALYPSKRSIRGEVYWMFKCSCGNTKEILAASVKQQAKRDLTGILPSCGCIRNKVAAERAYKHGFGKHPLCDILRAMKQRCYNPNCEDYPAYGGIGVTVCDEWLNDSNTFYTWAIANGWYKGCHVDKDIIDKEAKIYSPATCSIVSPHENLSFRRNKRKKG